MTILSEEDEDNLEVTEERLELYMEFLQKNVEMPCLLTGTEDFSWEEKYVIGGASRKEYEMLEKTRPSYTDIFELIEPISEYDLDRGLFAKVRRKKDKRVFTLPLADLEATEEELKNYELLDDYSVWLVNYM